MTTNDLVYKIAERVKVLANMKLDDLRAIPSNTADTRSGAIREHRHENRGELIELVLEDEFVEEHPDEIVDDALLSDLRRTDLRGKVIDHIDGNPRNNDLVNLRVTTLPENRK